MIPYEYDNETEFIDMLDVWRAAMQIAQKNHNAIVEQEMQRRREKYKYGFKQIKNIEDIVDKQTFYDNNTIFGYITYDGEVVDSEHIVVTHNVQALVDDLNRYLVDGKKYEFVSTMIVVKLSDITKSCYKDGRLDGKTKEIETDVFVFDVQNQKFVVDTKKRWKTDMYIYKNVLKIGHEWVFIPTNTVVLNTAYVSKNDFSKPEIHSYSTMTTDTYIIFPATKFVNNSYKNSIKTAYKLNIETGELSEV
jgi:hypothetical protein